MKTMIDQETRKRIIALVNKEVVPAIGCTEPMCVALCTAKATEQLGCRPEHIEAMLSANILKNAMGVGIPGTGMIGLPIAIALGAKPACSLKISSGVSTALLSSLLAMEGKCVTSSEGIVDDDVDQSIHNLTSIGADAMCKTDDMVLQIMASKGC